MLTMLLFALSGITCGATITIFRLMSDVRLWRDAHQEMRDCWKFERERRQHFQKRLEDMEKDPRDGVFR